MNRLAELEKQKMILQQREWMARMLDGDRASGTVQAFSESVGLPACTRFAIFCAEKEDVLNHQANWDESEWKLLQFAMQNIMEYTINEFGRGWCTVIGDTVCAVLIESATVEPEIIAERLHKRLYTFLKIEITLGLSTIGTMEKLNDAFERAITSSQYRYFVTGLPYIYDRKLPPAPESTVMSTNHIEKELIESLTVSTLQHIAKLSDQWLAAANREAWGNRNHFVYLAYGLLVVMVREALDMGLKPDIRDEKELMQRLNGFDTASSLGLFVKEEIQTLASLRHARTHKKEAELLASIKAYIIEHYGEDLSLEAMAAKFFMNPSYFSTFFKKHTGKNFKKYLTELRMKEAHRLLLHTNMMIYEIAERVGYNNSRQFSNMFKKYYGKLPNDYRQEESDL